MQPRRMHALATSTPARARRARASGVRASSEPLDLLLTNSGVLREEMEETSRSQLIRPVPLTGLLTQRPGIWSAHRPESERDRRAGRGEGGFSLCVAAGYQDYESVQGSGDSAATSTGGSAAAAASAPTPICALPNVVASQAGPEGARAAEPNRRNWKAACPLPRCGPSGRLEVALHRAEPARR
jgi:hypothetical protein